MKFTSKQPPRRHNHCVVFEIGEFYHYLFMESHISHDWRLLKCQLAQVKDFFLFQITLSEAVLHNQFLYFRADNACYIWFDQSRHEFRNDLWWRYLGDYFWVKKTLFLIDSIKLHPVFASNCWYNLFNLMACYLDYIEWALATFFNSIHLI